MKIKQKMYFNKTARYFGLNNKCYLGAKRKIGQLKNTVRKKSLKFKIDNNDWQRSKG